jgi:hypothetical protein
VTIIKSTFNIETKPFPDLIKIGWKYLYKKLAFPSIWYVCMYVWYSVGKFFPFGTLNWWGQGRVYIYPWVMVLKNHRTSFDSNQGF